MKTAAALACLTLLIVALLVARPSYVYRISGIDNPRWSDSAHVRAWVWDPPRASTGERVVRLDAATLAESLLVLAIGCTVATFSCIVHLRGRRALRG